MPTTAAEAVSIANSGRLAVPESITVRAISGEKYDRIVDYVLGPAPDLGDAHDAISLNNDASDFNFGHNMSIISEEEIPW